MGQKKYEKYHTRKKVAFITKWITILSLLLYPIINILVEITGITYGPRLNDYVTYYYAVERLFEHQSLHHSSIPDMYYRGDNQYVYPTITILLFVPFSVFPLLTSGVVFVIVSIAGLVWGVRYQINQFPYQPTNYQFGVLAWCVIGYAPIITGIKTGQVTVLVGGGLCILAGLLLNSSDERSNTLSGVLTVLIVFYKLYFVPLAAHLLTDKKRFRTAVASGILLVLSNIVIFGFDTSLAYVQHVIIPNLGETTTTHSIQWYATVFQPWHLFGQGGNLIKAVLLLLVIVLALVYRDKQEVKVFYLGLSIIPLASPQINVLNLIVLVPIYVHYLAGAQWSDHKRTLGFLSLFLVHIHPYTIEFLGKFGPRYVPSLTELVPLLPVIQPALWGTLILFGLLLHEIISVPKGSQTDVKKNVGDQAAD